MGPHRLCEHRLVARPYRLLCGGCQDYVRPELDLSVPRTGPPPLLSLIDQYLYCDANARLAAAYLEAWWLLGLDDCRQRALGILDELWDRCRAPDGGMFHYLDGEAYVPGLLMDSVRMGQALLTAYGCIGDERYLERAQVLAAEMVRQHRNPTGGFNDIRQLGPANLQIALPILTQNAAAAAFFVDLADLSGRTRGIARWPTGL